MTENPGRTVAPPESPAPYEHDVEMGVEFEQGEFDTIAVTPSKERNPWVVLISTSLAVFAVFLDTTIGFVSFPAISDTFRAAGDRRRCRGC